jgi:archaellum component FlaC
MVSEDNTENNDTPQEPVEAETQADNGTVEADSTTDTDADNTAQTQSEIDESPVDEMLTDAREIADRLEVLMPAVLDSAEATNNTAEVATKASAALEAACEKLKNPVNDLVTASLKNAEVSSRVLFGSVAALLVAVGLFSFMSFQLSDRVSKVDAMLMAVSKRVIDMNSALSSFERLNMAIAELAVQQEKFASNQVALARAVADTQETTNELRDKVPEVTAKTVGEKTDNVVNQIASLEKSLQNQGRESVKVTGSVANLGKRLKTLEEKLEKVDRLNADVEALIKLERDNYLEVLRRQADLQAAEQGNSEEEVVIADPTIVVYPIYRPKSK